VHSFVIGGAHPYRDSRWDAFGQVDGTDREAFMAALEEVIGERIPPEMKPLVVANDLRALAAAAKKRSSLGGLGTMAVRRMLFVGEEDPRYPGVRECAQRIPQATPAPLPGQTHVTGFVRRDLVVPYVMRFLAATPH
jgi:hypothetical protein